MNVNRQRLTWGAAYALALAIAAGAFFVRDAAAQTVRVDTLPEHVIKFDPDAALGSSMDILPHSVVDIVYSEPFLKESLSPGWGPITYRRNTELTARASHWIPNTTFTDPP